MESRLYPSTRPLLRQLAVILAGLGLASLASLKVADLITLYLLGLILLDRRQTPCQIAFFLPARAHDALNRLLRVVPLSSRALMRLLIALAKRCPGPGFLIVDHTTIPKPYAQKIPWVGGVFSTTENKPVWGMHLVLLLWSNGRLRIPVGFRLWRPRQSCRPGEYRTKVQLAQDLLLEVLAAGLSVEYVTFDSWYTARWFCKFLDRRGLIWIGELRKNSRIIYQHQRYSLEELVEVLHLTDQAGPLLWAGEVYRQEYGTVRLLILRRGDGKLQYVVTPWRTLTAEDLHGRVRSRWQVEREIRDAKQFLGLGACQARADGAMVRHMALALVGYAVLQLLAVDPAETAGDVKRRLQLRVWAHGAEPVEGPSALSGSGGKIRLNPAGEERSIHTELFIA